MGGTIHKGEDVNPALPGRRGTVAGIGGAAGVSTVSTVSTGVSGGGGGAGGRGIKGAEVNPQGFLLIIGATGTKRGGAAVVAVASCGQRVVLSSGDGDLEGARSRRDILFVILRILIGSDRIILALRESPNNPGSKIGLQPIRTRAVPKNHDKPSINLWITFPEPFGPRFWKWLGRQMDQWS